MAVALAAVVSGFLSNLIGASAWIIAVVAVLGAWRYVPGFWRTIMFGALGGIVAGVLILGPGFRLAMRVVAILDPIRTPEFTVGGTLFIIVGVGVMLGGLIAVVAALIRRAFALSVTGTALGMTALLMGLLLLAPDLRSEFVELGAGPWLNIPMFTSVALLYGTVANRLTDRFQRRRAAEGVAELVEVPRLTATMRGETV
jgi:hypothetical protein